MQDIPIAQIRIGTRSRKDMGDLEGLADSIAKVGLLQYLGITPEKDLVFGERRLRACRDILGWKSIPARIVQVESIAAGEYEENLIRKEFTPSERVAIVDSLRTFGHGGDRKSDQSRDCDVETLTVDQAAERAGFKRDDYFRAKNVVERGTPELVEAMDRKAVSIFAAAAIAAASKEEQSELLARPPQEGRLTAKAVKDQRRKLAREKQRRDALAKQVATPSAKDDIRLYRCRFQELERVAGIEPETVHLILTDPPYGKDFLPQWKDLAAFAERVLAPGGLFVCHYGHTYLPQALEALGKRLCWGWMAMSTWHGPANEVHHRQVFSRQKPILIYSKGKWRRRKWWYDPYVFEGREKDYHEWQQPLPEVEKLLSDFSQPGDLVVDPCGGGFTTAVACYRQGRKCISCDCDKVTVLMGQERLAQEGEEVATFVSRTD